VPELTTLEEASKCPRCDLTGEVTSTRKAPKTTPDGDLIIPRVPDGAMVRTYECQNERCTWYGTGWVVQVNPDNTVPIRARGGRGSEKQFPVMSREQQAMGRRTLEQIQAEEAEARRNSPPR
jgi:hypothetical protein